MPPRKLRAGKGARGTILTKFIKPPQHNDEADHRTDVIIDSRYIDQKNKTYYKFRIADDDEVGDILHGSSRLVKIVEEGDPEEFFDGPPKNVVFEEPEIKWEDSEAYQLLKQDLNDGTVPTEVDPNMPTRSIYMMRPEYAEYDPEKFSSRLSGLRAIVRRANTRAEEDEAAFLVFIANHPISLASSKGYPQWQGSEAQQFAKEDIKNKVHQQEDGYRKMYNLRPDIYGPFGFKAFSDKVRQEIRTAKFLHTLRVTGSWKAGIK